MSRSRSRPTREETRSRLFRAAAEVFAVRGLGGATVEQVAARAGFSRGAFYSNFATKDELLVAMLEDHVRRSVAHNQALLAAYPDSIGFVEAMRAEGGREHDPLHHSPLLQIEMILHVARHPTHRASLRQRLRTMRAMIGEIVVRSMRTAGVGHEIDAAVAGTLLLAIEDGLRLHRLIDPASTPADAFLVSLRFLQDILLATRRPPGRSPARKPVRARTRH